MMKKIIKNRLFFYLVLLFLFTAIFFNWNNFRVFFYNTIWNISFAKWDYWLSIIYHNNSSKIDNNEVFNYNLWWDYYKLWNYEKSLEYYSKINLFSWSNLSLDTFYNLWNIYYFQWEKEIYDIQKKIDLWKKSLLSYNQVLLKKEDKKARDNYNFVNKKLNELMKQMKKQQEDYKKQQEEQNKKEEEQKKNDEEKENNGEKNDKKSDEQKKEEKSSENTKNKSEEQNQNAQTVQWWRGEEYKVWESEQLTELTQKEKEDLQKYNEQLKQNQQQNTIYFGKKNTDTKDNQSMLDMFMQDPFFSDLKNFDDSTMNKNERDW